MMKRFLKSFHYGQKGFTLIELLIVILILGVLAAVIIPNVANFTKSAQKAAAQSEMSSVQIAVYAAMADNGTGTIAGGDISSSGDLSDYPCASWLQNGLANLDGIWTAGTDGLIISGSFPETTPSWTYAAGVWTRVP